MTFPEALKESMKSGGRQYRRRLDPGSSGAGYRAFIKYSTGAKYEYLNAEDLMADDWKPIDDGGTTYVLIGDASLNRLDMVSMPYSIARQQQ